MQFYPFTFKVTFLDDTSLRYLEYLKQATVWQYASSFYTPSVCALRPTKFHKSAISFVSESKRTYAEDVLARIISMLGITKTILGEKEYPKVKIWSSHKYLYECTKFPRILYLEPQDFKDNTLPIDGMMLNYFSFLFQYFYDNPEGLSEFKVLELLSSEYGEIYEDLKSMCGWIIPGLQEDYYKLPIQFDFDKLCNICFKITGKERIDLVNDPTEPSLNYKHKYKFNFNRSFPFIIEKES